MATGEGITLARFPSGTEFSDDDYVYMTQDGATVKGTVAQLKTAVAISATQETFVAGDGVTPGTYLPGSSSITFAGTYGSINDLDVYVGAVPQLDCTLSGQTLGFNPSIPAGTSKIVVRGKQARSIGTPSDATITDAKLSPGSRIYNRSFFSVDLMDYGADRFGVLASDAALTAALIEAANRGGAKITAPRGRFKFTSKKTYTHPAATACLAIEGAGPGLTEFSWTGADALQVNYIAAFNSFQLRGLTLSTATTGGAGGIVGSAAVSTFVTGAGGGTAACTRTSLMSRNGQTGGQSIVLAGPASRSGDGGSSTFGMSAGIWSTAIGIAGQFDGGGTGANAGISTAAQAGAAGGAGYIEVFEFSQ